MRTATRREALRTALGLLVATAGVPCASAQATGSPFAVLKGRWVRPDGGYTITIRSVDAKGQMEASYANPRPLPFSKAEARIDGQALDVFLELQAGGYHGSSYRLRYDPADDTLKGVYHQAVAQQRFEVRFVRLGT